MKQFTESDIRETQRERSYEYGLPDYLQHDLDTYKEGLKSHSPPAGLLLGRALW